MNKYNSFYSTVDQIISYGIDKGILHLSTGTGKFSGAAISLNDRAVNNFGSCSYLGLEFDERLKNGAITAIDLYGTQFSESRAYVSLGLYDELQRLFEKIFEAPCVITPTTTLGHIANIPIMVETNHAVIMDQQVHNSVQTAVEIIKARGVHIELVRHNRMDLLEERIIALRDKHEKVWYMADGIYSMFGDKAPVTALKELMEKYACFHCYFDDAHGMGIYGKYGRGSVLGYENIHSKMVIATSLNKAFACGGGLLVYGDAVLAGKVSRAGGPLLSSGPMQPSALGAGIAAARILLSDELADMQSQLQYNIQYAHNLLKQYRLPLVSDSGAAIMFVGVSLPRMGHNLVRRMLDAGYYVNLGIFPTVPIKQTGIRFTITRLHTQQQIEGMISTLAREFDAALVEEGITMEQISKAFGRVATFEERVSLEQITTAADNGLQLTTYSSIKEIDKEEWNNVFRGKGTFDWDNLRLLEEIFSNHNCPENNWDFDYFLIKDPPGNIVACTFCSTALWKDDMLSDSGISAQVEELRLEDRYAFTSRVTCTGSLITEGEHFYINRQHPYWQNAVKIILEKIGAVKIKRNAQHIVLRDFKQHDTLLDSFMLDNGFFKVNMPNSNIVETMNCHNPSEWYNSLSKNSRDQLRKKVLRNAPLFETRIVTGRLNENKLQHLYSLYLQVKNKNLSLNTFALPLEFFRAIMMSEKWELIELSLIGHAQPCCYVVCHNSPDVYIPMVIGIDYSCDAKYNIYRQALFQVMLRANILKAGKVLFGFSADIEKQKMGAVSFPMAAYMQTLDSFNMEKLMAMRSK